MRNFYKSLFLTTFITSLCVLQSTYAYAGGRGKDTDSESPKSVTVSLSVPPRLEEGKKLASELLERGYFVHLTGVDLLDPKTDLKLFGGAVTPLNFDRDRAFSFKERVKASPNPTPAELKAVTEIEQHIATHGDAPVTFVPNPESFRPCIYFSLHGPLTNSHDNFHLEHRKQAVLIPTQYLLPYVVNLYPSDTAAWLPEINLREIPGARLFLSESSILPSELDLGTLQIERYSGSLPQAVRTWLQRNTDRCLDFFDAPEGKDALLDQALLDGHDLTHPDFFEEFLRDHPHTSFGHEAVAKKTGLGSMISYFHNLVEDFARLYKYGIYKKPDVSPPKVVNKYRLESIVVFAEHLLDQLEKDLSKWGNEAVLRDFRDKQAPKARLAIANLKNYAKHNKENESYKNRAHTFDITIQMAQHPFAWVQTILEDAAFSEIREEFEVMYWVVRVCGKSLGILPVDEHQSLEKLKEAALKLRTKVMSKEKNFSYVQLVSGVFHMPAMLPDTNTTRTLYSDLIKALMPALPCNGRVIIETSDREIEFTLKQTLNDYRISIPKKEWSQGISFMPTFKTKRSFANML